MTNKSKFLEMFNLQRLIIVGSSVLGIIGIFLPWLSVSALGFSKDVNGFAGDGWIDLVLFIAIIVLSVVTNRSSALTGAFKWIIFALSIVTLVVVLVDVLNTAASFSKVGASEYSSMVNMSYGPGLFIVAIASIAILVLSLLSKKFSK